MLTLIIISFFLDVGECFRYNRGVICIQEESLAYCRDALAAALPTGNQGLIGFAHFVLGNRLLWTGHLESVLQAWDADQQEEARTLLQQAVPLPEEMGYL